MVLSLFNRTDEAEFICVANGTGNVKPTLEWMVEGVNADRNVLRSWTVSQHVCHLSVLLSVCPSDNLSVCPLSVLNIRNKLLFAAIKYGIGRHKHIQFRKMFIFLSVIHCLFSWLWYVCDIDVLCLIIIRKHTPMDSSLFTWRSESTQNFLNR
jgi:hypothetical protein